MHARKEKSFQVPNEISNKNCLEFSDQKFAESRNQSNYMRSTAQKVKLSIKDFFSDQICSVLRKKSIMKNFIFCTVIVRSNLSLIQILATYRDLTFFTLLGMSQKFYESFEESNTIYFKKSIEVKQICTLLEKCVL